MLPFESLGPNPSETYFAAGLQDDIMANLTHVAGLKVIGPESVRAYPAGHPDLAAIGRELGVDHLLEGSVWRDGGHARVSLRLTDAGDPTQSWSKQYECDSAHVPDLRGETAREVAERLCGFLPTGERAMIGRPLTKDPAAYDLYLRVLAEPTLAPDEVTVRRDAARRIGLLDAAVARDPGFVLAYCELARAHDEFVGLGFGSTPEEHAVDHRTLAEVALQKARRLQPDAGEVHLALARHFFWASKDSEQAMIEANLAIRALPNNAEAQALAARIDRLMGHWEEALRAYETAVSIKPHDNGIRDDLANTYGYLRRYEPYEREMTRLLADIPTSEQDNLSLELARGRLEAEADLAPLRGALTAAVDPDPHLHDDYGVILALFERDSAGLDRFLAASPQTQFLVVGFAYPKTWFTALAARRRGDEVAARTAFAAARVEVEKSVLEDAADARALGLLAMIDAGLGRREAATRQARRACGMMPVEKQAVSGPTIACCLAAVYAWTDQRDLAFAELNRLVSLPAGSNLPNQPTFGDLRLNPLWDPLRADPRFAGLVARLAPKTVR